MPRTSKKEIKAFNDWCKLPPQKANDDTSTRTLARGNPANHDQYQAALYAIRDGLNERRDYKHISLNSDLKSAGDGYTDNIFTLLSTTDALIHTLEITIILIPPNQLLLSNLTIWKCIFTDSAAKQRKSVVFENCRIANLYLSNEAKVTLINTKIRVLKIDNHVHQIDMKGGCVLDIDVVAPSAGTNPLTGSVDFKRTLSLETENTTCCLTLNHTEICATI